MSEEVLEDFHVDLVPLVSIPTITDLKMSACKRILIFGATGLIGRHIVRQILTRKGDFEHIAIFTSPDTVESKREEIRQLEAEGIEILVGSLMNEADVRKAYEGEHGLHFCHRDRKSEIDNEK